MALAEHPFLAHSGRHNLPLPVYPLHHGSQPQTRHRDEPDCRVADRGDPGAAGRGFGHDV